MNDLEALRRYLEDLELEIAEEDLIAYAEANARFNDNVKAMRAAFPANVVLSGMIQ